MPTNRKSLLLKLDFLWLAISGLEIDVNYALDMKAIRKPLTTKGTIKTDLSLFPGADRKLEAVCAKYGGWTHITSSEFMPTDEIYEELSAAGFSRECYDKSREYLSNPTAYTQKALASRI